MWIEDLQPFDFLVPESRRYLRAIGWLTGAMPYRRGEVDRALFTRLCELIQHPWSPPIAVAGVHRCELCKFTGGADAIFNKSLRVPAVCNAQLYVPGDGVLFVAPVTIAHYIDAHEYSPPEQFQDAVRRCPSMRSIEYLKVLMENGGREFLTALKEVSSQASHSS